MPVNLPNLLKATVLAAVVSTVATPSRAQNNHASGPEAAKESLSHFKVAPGLAVSLYASEPMVRNPTDMDIDERGRVWITEGVNYRSSFQPWGVLQPAGDRIVILEDTNGEGFADKETVFYQGPEINAALGICVLGNKVIVSCSPNIYVFTDTDGDGKADKKEILFSGISGVDHDHGIHAVTFGPDGKLYFNFGNEGHQIKDKDGKPITDLAGNVVNNSGHPYRQGMAFRCNPDGSEFEVLAYNFRNPYEVAVDSYGGIWQSDNDDDGNQSVRINYLMEYGNYGFTDEITGAGWPEPRSNLEPDIPRRHWRQNDPGVVPNLLITGAGAPTGLLVYEGSLLPGIYSNQMIHADAGARVVRAYPVQPDGAGYKATIVNLLTTDDTWFRPSDVCAAPDGSLYVADWNDSGVGGHYMADQKLERMTGRVYRLAPPGKKPLVPKLDLTSPAGCVHALQSPNLSTRYLAWTALREMGGKAEKELLKLWDTSGNDRMRSRALFLLARLPGKEDKYIQKALGDPNANLRMAGLRIAREAKLDPIPYVQKLVNDESARVRGECAISLRHNESPEAAKLWTALAFNYDGKDRWYLEALGIGADRQEDKFFDAWLKVVGGSWFTPAGRDIVWRSRATASAALLYQLILQKDPEQSARYFRAFDFLKGSGKTTAMTGLLAAATAGPDPNHMATEALSRLSEKDFASTPGLKAEMLKVLESVRGTGDFVKIVQKFHLPGQTAGLLEVAIQHPKDEAGTSAMRLILADHDTGAINAALRATNTAVLLIEAMGNAHENAIVPLLLPVVTDATIDIAARREAVRALSRVREGANGLLALAREDKLPADLKFTATTELNQVRWSELKREAAKLLPMPQARNSETLPPIAELLHKHGDAAHGAEVFARADVGCIKCHRVNDKGVDLGPALSEIGTKLGKDALYESILEPSAGIAFGYENWQLTLKSGDDVSGIITSETPDELTIKDATAIPRRIKKSDIVTRQKSKLSLMPAGLQQTMTTQELVDLVEYLSSLKKPE